MKTVVMGILNATPDSFYSGSRVNRDSALLQAQKMLQEGAGILDVGGESTRPFALPITQQEELDRVIPIIELIKKNVDIPISIDTSDPRVMQEAINAGANFINDVRALTREGALEMAATLGVPVCLMHMQHDPMTMQKKPHYVNVVFEVTEFFKQRLDACRQAGITQDCIWLDPGFGFGKMLAHNLSLLKHINHFHALGYPLLVGLSRKRMFEHLLGVKEEERLPGSLAAAVLAYQQGVRMIRVHDVKETVEALAFVKAVEAAA